MRKRSTEAFASAEFGETRQQAAPRACDAPGCVAEGCFPAPRERGRPKPYLYFCLEHVRAYNAGWDYYRGMSADEIEADRRLDVVWRRPTWALGGGAAARATASFHFEDPLATAWEIDPAGEAARPRVRRFRPSSPEARAQSALDLDDDFDLAVLKIRYKTLVKRWHPDANGGSRVAEERLKTINDAYRTLRRALGA